jgi:RNA polymerase sigma factor (sigma-70 family)
MDQASRANRATAATRDASKVGADALAALRPDMLRFAQLQLRDRATAEELAREAIEAAPRRARFEGKSSVKTWVFAILRNRVVDPLRSARRTVPMSSLVDDADDWQERLAAPFDDAGRWRGSARPQAPARSGGVDADAAVPGGARGRPRPSAAEHRARVHDARVPRLRVGRDLHAARHQGRQLPGDPAPGAAEAAWLPGQRLAPPGSAIAMPKRIEVTDLCSQERPGLHPMMCTGCGNYRRQMQALRRFARAWAEGRAEGDGPGEPAAR